MSNRADDARVASRVVVCVATFERPEPLRRCLNSLAVQRFPTVEPTPSVEVIVVDNAPHPDSRVEQVAAGTRGIPVRLLHHPEPGIPQARNRALAEALRRGADVVATLDDDETACDCWLDELLTVVQRYHADVVAGPVLPDLLGPSPAWVRRGRFFERPRTATGTDLAGPLARSHLRSALVAQRGGGIPVPSTNNLMLRRGVIERVGWFDETLALTGGSDREYLERVAATGARIIWADDAQVEEQVPPERQTVRWLARRAYRLGNNIGQRATTWRQRIAAVTIALAVLTSGLVAGMGSVLGDRPVRSRQAACRIARSFGVVAGLMGRAYEEYRREPARGPVAR